MSLPQPAAPAGTPALREAKERHRMSKVLYRVKTVFKKGADNSKRGPALPLDLAPPQPPVIRPASQPAPDPQPRFPYEEATKMSRAHVHDERAKKLGARFGLEIKPNEWDALNGDVYRVEKSARMRIHRECHRCNTTFNVSNECPSCQHVRCKKCVRQPLKRTESERQTNREKREALVQRNKEMQPIVPSHDPYPKEITLTRPRPAGGQDLVYKKIRQRVRRHCHVCSALITSNSKQARTCDGCGHKRCADCPRKPAERPKYPYGYPHDEPGNVFKGVYACQECKTKFAPDAVDGTPCDQCSHPKCSTCQRIRPRKLDPEPDPEALERIQQQYMNISIGAS